MTYAKGSIAIPTDKTGSRKIAMVMERKIPKINNDTEITETM